MLPRTIGPYTWLALIRWLLPHPYCRCDHNPWPGVPIQQPCSRGMQRGNLPSVPEPLQFRLIDAAADAAGIDQAVVRIVISEQQSADIRAGPFGVGPADHHEFLAVQAFHFKPQAAIAGRIRVAALLSNAGPPLHY